MKCIRITIQEGDSYLPEGGGVYLVNMKKPIKEYIPATVRDELLSLLEKNKLSIEDLKKK